MENNNSVIVKDVNKRFKDTLALDNISFNVKKNELFGFIGPDGAGKTTLFRILTTLMLPDSGTAMVCGFDVVKEFKKIRRNIGYMAGRFSLYQDLSVEENLSFYATIFGTTIKENYSLIKDIYSHIEPFKKRRAGALSGGMKQKLALSCALIHRPEILILDEPTTGVDAVSRKEFWEMLVKLKENNITIIVSTPYMDEASLCDSVALMQNGKIMSVDHPQNITSQFDKEIYLIRAENMYRLIQDLRKYQDTESVYPFGQNLHYINKHKIFEIDNIINYLTGLGHKSIVIERTNPEIEDCFMYLMSKNTS